MNKAPETRGGINWKTISICIDPNQEKFPVSYSDPTSLTHLDPLVKVLAETPLGKNKTATKFLKNIFQT